MPKKIHDSHAGEILKFEFLDKLNMSQNALAKAINIPANQIHAIIRGERSITANTDLHLCRFFGLSKGYFLRLQLSYELSDVNQMKYKGYLGEVTYDDKAELFHGEVIGLKDIITFQGKSVNELKEAFQNSINDYLAWCEEHRKQPEKT